MCLPNPCWRSCSKSFAGCMQLLSGCVHVSYFFFFWMSVSLSFSNYSFSASITFFYSFYLCLCASLLLSSFLRACIPLFLFVCVNFSFSLSLSLCSCIILSRIKPLKVCLPNPCLRSCSKKPSYWLPDGYTYVPGPSLTPCLYRPVNERATPKWGG